MTFRKRTARGKTLLQPRGTLGSPWTLFPKTPKWLRSGHEPATGSLTRTRPEEAYLGVLCGGAGGAAFLQERAPRTPCGAKETIQSVITNLAFILSLLKR